MEKTNEVNKLSVAQRMRDSEKLGAKVATIINKARATINKVLASSGYGVNIRLDWYRLDEVKNEEVTNG
jgi:hypothetical protein